MSVNPWGEIVSTALGKLLAGEIDERGKTVGDVFPRILRCALTAYLHSDGSLLSREMQLLVEALRDENDPIRAELGVDEMTALWSFLNTLTKTKEMLHGKADEATPAAAAATTAGPDPVSAAASGG